jgi:hypothetical protein
MTMPPHTPPTTPPPSTKVTVKLNARSMAALERASELVDLNKTDTINRAIQFYATMLARSEDGIVTVLNKGQYERLHM